MFYKIISEDFPKKRVVIIGDLVADQFLNGTIARVSREAPVFILRHDLTETVPGGAANAAVNVASLGGKATLVGLVGNDENGKKLSESLKNSGVNCDALVISNNFTTTTKVRVLAAQHLATKQQVIRIDYENSNFSYKNIAEELKKSVLHAVKDADAIIFSDYNYGVITSEIAEFVGKFARENKIPLLVDSRYKLQTFNWATSATPNYDEVEELLGSDFAEQDCVNLLEKLGFESLLITLGSKGMLLIEKGKKPIKLEAIGSKEPVDGTGAGDSVIATYALALASGMNFEQAATLANHAGGIVVMKKGTASVSSGELLSSINI
jgi:D-glycero-beta-D-manno-heptose-7-phosphate kinase